MKVDQERCIGCGACMGICPIGAIIMEEGKAKIDPEKCISCRSCEGVCPVEAISDEE